MGLASRQSSQSVSEVHRWVGSGECPVSCLPVDRWGARSGSPAPVWPS